MKHKSEGIPEEKLNGFLREFATDSDYRFLECGKDDDELKKVCEKAGIQYPSIDLAILKMKYATIGEANRNFCVLQREEVEKALPTIAGKAMDFEHVRDRVCGFLLSGEIVNDDIVVYGAFFRSSLGEDFELIKELFDKKRLAVSFEAWGTREFHEDQKTYNLKDIIFCGVGLLLHSSPACPDAGVLEMANKRVLEFAKIEDKATFIRSGEKDTMLKEEEMKIKKIEVARLYSWDIDTIMRMAAEIDCPICKAKGCNEINTIDFRGNNVNTTCWMCGTEMQVSMSPRASIVLKDVASRNITEITKVEKTEEKSMKTEEKALPEEVAELIKEEEQVEAEKPAEAEEIVEEIVEELVEEVIEQEKQEEKQVELSKELDVLKSEVSNLKEQLLKARDEGKVIGERRFLLGEYAKELSDDDILDNVKFDNASLRKKVAELEGKKEVASVAHQEQLEVGTKNKQVNKQDTSVDFAERVRKTAWNL
jgi:hypothetical protein